jgi:hypothetical protein
MNMQIDNDNNNDNYFNNDNNQDIHSFKDSNLSEENNNFKRAVEVNLEYLETIEGKNFNNNNNMNFLISKYYNLNYNYIYNIFYLI